MVGRIAKIAGMSLGYALYTAVVTAVLLWYLFPASTVRDWLRFRLHKAVPGVEWKIGSLGLALPGRLEMRNVRLNSSKQPKTELLALNRVALGPDIAGLIQERKMRGLVHLTLASGSIDSLLSADVPGSLDVEGQVQDVRVEELQGVQAVLGRKISGTLSGTFRGRVDLQDPGKSMIRADLLLAQGELTFRKPVLGLDRLPFARLGTSLSTKRKQFRLEKGSVGSRLLQGEFHGTIIPGSDLAGSAIRVEGVVRPRPELFARLGSSRMVRFVRSRLRKGALAFSVSGSLAEPGILFPDLAGAMGENLPGEDQ